MRLNTSDPAVHQVGVGTSDDAAHSGTVGADVGNRVKCAACGHDIHVDHFAGVCGGDFYCDSIPCLIVLSDRISNSHADGSAVADTVRRDVRTCPDCGGTKFDRGASGGNSENIRCRKCGQWWNDMGPFGFERIHGPNNMLTVSGERQKGQNT
jgi:predicted RNA-binding Zn-ribbon protein involved in translation (DUF1610 family)